MAAPRPTKTLVELLEVDRQGLLSPEERAYVESDAVVEQYRELIKAIITDITARLREYRIQEETGKSGLSTASFEQKQQFQQWRANMLRDRAALIAEKEWADARSRELKSSADQRIRRLESRLTRYESYIRGLLREELAAQDRNDDWIAEMSSLLLDNHDETT